MATIEERLLAKLDRSGECWIFTGCTDPGGYGLLWDNRRRNNSRAHRIAYEIWIGPIPDGADVHHTCPTHTPGCCRPEHLRALPADEHNSMHHRKTHCARGHRFTGEKRRGQQICRTCLRDASRRHVEANRERINERRRVRRRAAAR